MLNRRFCFALCAALLLSFSGCGNSRGSDIPAEGTDSSVAVVSPSQPESAAPLRVLNIGAVTSTGYYFVNPVPNRDNSLTMMYLDFEKGTESPLCFAEGCTHSGPDCQANLPASGGGCSTLAVEDQLVLAFTGSIGSNQELGEASYPRIQIMSPDGSSRTEIVRFGAGQELYDPYVTDGENLYCTLETEENNESRLELVCVNLSNGKLSTLHTFGTETLVGACDGYFLLTDYTSEGQRIFLRMDAVSLQQEEIFRPTDDHCSIRLEGPYLYALSRSENALHRLDCRTLEDTVAAENFMGLTADREAYILGALDGHILLNVYEPSTEESTLLSIDTATGEQIPFTLLYPDAFGTPRVVPILARIPGQETYLVTTGETMIDVQTLASDGTDMTARIPREIHALISISDYWNSNPNDTQVQTVF